MFKIGICINRLVQKEEVYAWTVQWATRQGIPIKAKQLSASREMETDDFDVLLMEEDKKGEDKRIISVSSLPEKEEIYEKLTTAYREFLSDDKSYVHYQRPRYIKKNLKNVIYFTSDKRKIIMCCTDGCYEFYGKLNRVEEEIAAKDADFIRTHQSHLINREYISKYKSKEVLLKNGEILTISKNRKNSARKKFYCLSET